MVLESLWNPHDYFMKILMLNNYYRKFQLNEVMLVKDNRRAKQSCFSSLCFMTNRGKGETAHVFQGDRGSKRVCSL